jgi:hypothetical protein
MTYSFPRIRVAKALSLPLAAALAAACGGSGKVDQTSSTTSGSGGGGATTSGTTGGGGHGGSGATSLSLPQLVHGAARVDTAAFLQIPVVVGVSGATPDAVTVSVDGNATPAQADGGNFVATVPLTGLTNGPHMLVAEATSGGSKVASASGTLVVGLGSLQFTKFASVGPAYASHLVRDLAGDTLAYTWVDVATGTHVLHLNHLDGAFQRLSPTDITLNDAADEPLDGYTAFGADAIGVVYRIQNPSGNHWLVKMRVVGLDGTEKVPAMDLTNGQAAFSVEAAGVDPGGFSAAWLHISPAPDPNNPPPVEIRFARWDTQKNQLVGPITLDMDQPAPPTSQEGTQILEPLAPIGIACNSSICLVSYTRDLYNAEVLLNIPKLFLAVIDLSTGKLAGTPTPVEATDWDTQMFGQHLVTLADGSFALVYTANDTVAAVTPKSPCDDTLERDLIFAAKIDDKGVLVGKPKAIFDYEGSREYPRVAEHPEGFALFWEDQRSECGPNGHIRMAANLTGPDLGSLLDPYLEMPGSIGLPPEDPTLAVTGTSFVAGWSDNRDGNGLVQPEPEIFFDTYWRK